MEMKTCPNCGNEITGSYVVYDDILVWHKCPDNSAAIDWDMKFPSPDFWVE